MSGSKIEDALARVARDLSKATEAIEALRAGNRPPSRGQRQGGDEEATERPERHGRPGDVQRP